MKKQIQCRDWVWASLRKIEQDFHRSADTHLFKLDWEALEGIDIYFKDESIHPTGSLKHRLARSLFLYAICNGFITKGTPVVEASSGSTAVSEAYFAKLLGLRFIAVMPKRTSRQKIQQIEFYGGECHFVENHLQIYEEARGLAAEISGHYMDQFTYAEQVTDWRGNNNIAEAIFEEMSLEKHPEPQWVVVGAGTGGTSATIGRFIRYTKRKTQLCVVDPENSVFFDYFNTGNAELKSEKSSDIEGIGRPKVEASFVPQVVDKMLQIPNAAAYAAIRYLEKLIGKKCGGSTGTNFMGCLLLAKAMRQMSQTGSIVTLICDPGDRYMDTYYNDEWLLKKGYDIEPYIKMLERLNESRNFKDIQL